MSQETAEKHVFEVQRRLPKYLGWACLVLCLAGIPFIISDPTSVPILGIITVGLFGLGFILSARNVKQIIVSQKGITFQPCGADVLFADIRHMNVPDWADRFDTPPRGLASVTFDMHTRNWSFVPGAVFRWPHGGRINIYGCDSIKLMNTLRNSISE